MAFALSKQGSIPDDARVSYPPTNFLKSTSAGYTGDWEIFFDIEVTGSDLPFLSADFNSSQLIFFRAGNRLEFRRSQSATVQVTLNQNYLARSEYRIVGRSATSDIAVFQNDVLCGTIPLNSIDELDGIFAFGNSSREGLLYSLKFYNNGALERDYTKESLVGTNDTEYTEQANSQHGMLINFPIDNSQWVFYEDGGGSVTADTAYTINAPTFTSSASVTLPEPIADASFTLAAPTFTSSATVTLPEPIANGDFSIASPLFSANADASLPQPVANAGFTLNAPTFSASATATIPGFNASVAYSLNAPTFSADAAVTLPSPSADVSYTVTAPTFSVSATTIETGVKSDLLFSINQPLFSANAFVTLPDVVAECNITISTPIFSASCSVPAPRLQPRKTISVTSGRPRVIQAGARPIKTIRVN
ncbi:MAG: hypothetical protein WA981_03720 [Glaciecola sp.]